MSPRRYVPSGMRLREPPNSRQAMAFLISGEPKIWRGSRGVGGGAEAQQ